MREKVNIFWFRRDLRVEDNCGLYHALQSGINVLPIFIFDTAILNDLQDKKDSRVSFIYKEVEALKEFFEKKGSSLYVFHTSPEKAFNRLIGEYDIQKVYANHDYEPYGIARDKAIADWLEKQNVSFLTFKDMVVFEKNEVMKPDGTPYNVFTPYSVKWKERLFKEPIKEYDSEKHLNKLYTTSPFYFPDIEQLGFINSNIPFPSKEINTNKILEYFKNRDFPAIEGTSRLSLHLRFGTISIRKLVKLAAKLSEKWLNELIWREFYQMILVHYPHVVNGCFKKEYDFIVWENNEEHFVLWCEGKTGYPIVDAGMRELNKTGFMHNRVRMIVSSFLTKDLLIDWRWGEQYFAQKLLDFELASNNGGWQWAAGCGVDAAPYFRIFNPVIQAKKFDPLNHYIQKWVPEYQSPNYSKPIIDHQQAVKRTIATYKKGIIKN